MAKEIIITPPPGPGETKGFPASAPPRPNTGQPATSPPPKPIANPPKK